METKINTNLLINNKLQKSQVIGIIGIILLILLSCPELVKSQLERDRSIIIKEPYFKDPSFWPTEITEKFAEYVSLVEKEEVCNLIHTFTNFPDSIEDKIREKGCMPDHASLMYLLEEGKVDIAAKLIENIYLPNEVDPSDVVNGWISKTETKIKQINQLVSAMDYKKIVPRYAYLNQDNSVIVTIKLIEEGLVPEKLEVTCFKNMIVYNAIFQKKGFKYLVSDKKYLYDEVETGCTSNYNAYGAEIEINLIKKHKLKRWDTLFKKN